MTVVSRDRCKEDLYNKKKERVLMMIELRVEILPRQGVETEKKISIGLLRLWKVRVDNSTVSRIRERSKTIRYLQKVGEINRNTKMRQHRQRIQLYQSGLLHLRKIAL